MAGLHLACLFSTVAGLMLGACIGFLASGLMRAGKDGANG